MNQEKIDPLVKICENLPLDLTILEKNGCCKKPKADCFYNRTNLSLDLRICSKKTTTSLPLARSVI